MNADTKSNILTIALEAAQLELERTKMRLEDQQSKVVESTDKLTEEVSYLACQLVHQKHASEHDRLLYDAAAEALDILHPGDRDHYG